MDKKKMWLIKQLCSITLHKRENGKGFVTSLISPIVIKPGEFNEDELREIISETNNLISIYLENHDSVDTDELYNFVIENFSK